MNIKNRAMKTIEKKGGFISDDKFIGILPEIIGKRKSTIFWKMKNYWKATNTSEKEKEEEKFVKPEYLTGEKEQFIVYINGLTIAKQIEKSGGLIPYPFHLQKRDYGIRENIFWKSYNLERNKIIFEKGPSFYKPGYYLFWYIERPDEQIPGKNFWRRATISEAAEAIQIIYKVSGTRLLKNTMFIIKEKNDKILAVGKYQEGIGLEVWQGKKDVFNNNYKESLLLVHK